MSKNEPKGMDRMQAWIVATVIIFAEFLIITLIDRASQWQEILLGCFLLLICGVVFLQILVAVIKCAER